MIRRGAGYGIDASAEELDSERFEQLAAQARIADRGRDLAAVIDLTTTALALWRGQALVEVAAAEFARPHLARLGELGKRRPSCLPTADELAAAAGRQPSLLGVLPSRNTSRGIPACPAVSCSSLV